MSPYEQNWQIFTCVLKIEDKSIRNKRHFWTKTSPGKNGKVWGALGCTSSSLRSCPVASFVLTSVLVHWTTPSSKSLRKQCSKRQKQHNLLWLSYLDAGMLCVGVGVCAGGRLKRHWTNRTLVEDFTVRTLNVRLQCGHIRVHNIAMHTSVRKINRVVSARLLTVCDVTVLKTGYNEHILIALSGFA